MPTMNDVVTEVRGRLGDPSEAELPETQINRAVEGSLREFSRHHPTTVEVQVILIAGKAEYVLPSGSLEVAESADSSVYEREYLTGSDSLALGIPHNAYQPEDSFAHWRRIHNDYSRVRPTIESDLQVFDQNDGTCLLRIIPAPPVAGTLLLVVERIREVTVLTRRQVEGLVQWAEGDCLEFIGRKRSKSVTDIPTATGRLKLSDGKDLRDEGADLKYKQECKWGSGATVIEGG